MQRIDGRTGLPNYPSFTFKCPECTVGTPEERKKSFNGERIPVMVCPLCNFMFERSEEIT